MSQETEKELKRISSTKINPGHIMFCYNRVTKEISEVKYDTLDPMTTRYDVRSSKNIIIDKDCFYEQALNKKNFIKKLKKYGIVDEEFAKELEKTYVQNTRSRRNNSNRDENEDKWDWKL